MKLSSEQFFALIDYINCEIHCSHDEYYCKNTERAELFSKLERLLVESDDANHVCELNVDMENNCIVCGRKLNVK